MAFMFSPSILTSSAYTMSWYAALSRIPFWYHILKQS
jgi:hypothetical protein